uniref:DUF1336 domain-containing protein n=1 Tax=Macrostomum lignano TaxID=282301 RepID=A0A1I8IEU5_9PLAT
QQPHQKHQLPSDSSQCRLWCLSESPGRRCRRRNLRTRRVSLSTLLPTPAMSALQSQPRRCFVVAALTDGTAAVVQAALLLLLLRWWQRQFNRIARIGSDDQLVRDVLPFNAAPPPASGFGDNEASAGDNADDTVGFTAVMTPASASTTEPMFWLREFACRDDCKLTSESSTATSDVWDAWICRSAAAYSLPSNYERLVLCAAGRTFLCLFASHWSAGAALLVYRRAKKLPLFVVEFPQYAQTFPRYELHQPVWVNQVWFDRGITSNTEEDIDDNGNGAKTAQDEDDSAVLQPLLLFACPMHGFSRCLLLSCSRLGGCELDNAMATSAATTDVESEASGGGVIGMSRLAGGLHLVACSGYEFNGCKQFCRRRSVGLPH